MTFTQKVWVVGIGIFAIGYATTINDPDSGKVSQEDIDQHQRIWGGNTGDRILPEDIKGRRDKGPAPEGARGWDYENNRWLMKNDRTTNSNWEKGIQYDKDNPKVNSSERILSDSDIERIRKDLPAEYYLYTPGNPRDYKTTDQKIEEYLEDHEDEIFDRLEAEEDEDFDWEFN